MTDALSRNHPSINLQNVGSSANATATNNVPTGSLNGHSVRQADGNAEPSRLESFGKSVKDFFTAKLPHAMNMAAEKVVSLFQPSQAYKPSATVWPDWTPPTSPTNYVAKDPQDPKYLDKMKFPGDIYGSTADGANFGPQSMAEARGAIYATVAHEAGKVNASLNRGDTDAAATGSFLRGNDLATQKFARAEGGDMMRDARIIILDALGNSDKPIAWREEASDASRSKYPDVKDHGMSHFAAASSGRNAVRVAESVFTSIVGKPGDQTSINAAASRVPQNICDALAITFKAIDDNPNLTAGIKTSLKEKMASDMVMLRVVNPTISEIVGRDASIGPAAKQNMLELSKLMQNITNDIEMGDGKEAANWAAKDEMAKRGTHQTLRSAFKDFTDAVVARADANAVSTAGTDGRRMKTDYDTAVATKNSTPPTSSSTDASSLSVSQMMSSDGTFIDMYDGDDDAMLADFDTRSRSDSDASDRATEGTRSRGGSTVGNATTVGINPYLTADELLEDDGSAFDDAPTTRDRSNTV